MSGIRDLRRWADAAAAGLASGVVRPWGPVALARAARGVWRSGLTPSTLAELGAARHPDRTVLVDDLGELTYRDLVRSTEAVAASLHARRPDVAVVAVLCRNHRGFLLGLTVGSRLGAEVVLLNTETTPEQLARVVGRHRPDVVVHDEEHADAVAQAAPDAVRVLAWQEPGSTWPGPTLTGLAEQRCEPAPAHHGRARITLLTSGTTGLAKGVARDVDLVGLVGAGATGLAALRLREGDVAVVPAPFFHALGFALLVSVLALGGTVVGHRRFDARETLHDIATYRATVLTGVPVMLQRLVAEHDRGRDDVSSVRTALTGASAISPRTITAFQEVFGPVLVNLYGATETGIVSIATPRHLAADPTTVGPPALGVSVRILREDRTAAAAGETGTIFVRGGLVFGGYTPDGDDTPPAKEVVDGHVSTGDLGHLDTRGHLHVDGRDDDMVVTGGENVFPQEVERVLEEHPAVEEAVVVGEPHDELGQQVVAHVRPVAGERPDEEVLREHVRSRLERYKVPRRVLVVEDFPRNGTGKVVRSRLLDG